MIDAPDLFTRPTDPETSRAASPSGRKGDQAAKMRASQARVLQCFRLYGDMTDATLLDRLHDLERQSGFARLMSPSGARSRRSELSKPNEERLRELRTRWYHDHLTELGDNAYLGEAPIPAVYEAMIPATQRQRAAVVARSTLAIEGIRAPLWDTGRREKSVGGHLQIVWGLAR